MASAAGVVRAVIASLRRRISTAILLSAVATFIFLVYIPNLPKEDEMQIKLSQMQSKVEFLQSMQRRRAEDLKILQISLEAGKDYTSSPLSEVLTTVSPELAALLKNMSGSRAAEGVNPRNFPYLGSTFVYQLLPHLLEDPQSLKPAYHMTTGRNFMDIVIGVPTVKRDKESYLTFTIQHLVSDLTEEDFNTTMIVVFVGETDLEFVLNIAKQVETLFPREVANGMIEILSPSSTYYPDFEKLVPNLGDPVKRFRWRTKQNLDALFLMAYAQTKGTYFLLLEDDIISKKHYLKDIKQFTAETTINNPHWFFIEFCPIGGIGKLFRSSDLLNFITYLQLFYSNMPIDWLLESYLADRICTIDKTSKKCGKSKLEIRPKYTTSLFQHIGLYSSLKGKLQKIKDERFGKLPVFYPHSNPPLEKVIQTMEVHNGHTFEKAYLGESFFWAGEVQKGSVIEFYFKEPTIINRYTIRSGNVEHVADKFYDAVAEILPLGSTNFTTVAKFDEFGMADGMIGASTGPLAAMRIRVTSDSQYWVIISEIDLKQVEKGPAR